VRAMVSESAALRFLGMAKKADKLKHGEDTVFTVAEMGKARVITAASDAAANTVRKIKNNLPPGTVYIELPFSKTQLGEALGGREVAVAAITDHGMAAAFIQKLSAEFPGRFEEETQLLARKAEKVLRRRRETAAAKKTKQHSETRKHHNG